MLATLVGCAVGDALGVPFEMKAPSHKSFKDWDGMFRDGGTFRKFNKAGEWSDDTIASICLTESLLECNGFDVENVADKYLTWYKSGEFRGMGSTTSHALWRLKSGQSWRESGMVGDEFGGNGTAMRAAPIGIYYRNNIEKLVESAIMDATITHNSKEPKMGSVAIAVAVAELSSANSDWDGIAPEKSDVLNRIIDVICALGDSVVLQKLKLAKELLATDMPHEEALAKIGVRGYVPETVGAAMYCLVKTNSFKEAVLMAVRAGGDADTTGAICGAMAGTFYGLEGIPEEYHAVEEFENLKLLDAKLQGGSDEKVPFEHIFYKKAVFLS
eukprot:gnl/Spiro4/26683_TR13252_c1_g1_i2.p4 gnl/Spiro4/26683_TR13252_c1_g1~~gnl/Spiro4/26683_TR13252_c1_g1_i2.p4  ORF type:complete len:329 (-),score=-4.60 gnl/Spiro4/26683_TR13252_c1_g1_i2:7935-8921(-)